jgi:hypothetical protein
MYLCMKNLGLCCFSSLNNKFIVKTDLPYWPYIQSLPHCFGQVNQNLSDSWVIAEFLILLLCFGSFEANSAQMSQP